MKKLSKIELRENLIKLRHGLSKERREEARQSVVEMLVPHLQGFSRVLSFASKEEEIDLWPLNALLAKEKRLAFPRLVSEIELLPFAVENFEDELSLNPKWKVLEPNPDKCPLIALDHIDCVLVPGLGFDAHYQRVGYGKGHYDRFLSKLHCPFYGIGFKEQHVTTPITVKSHDIPLTEVYLF